MNMNNFQKKPFLASKRFLLVLALVFLLLAIFFYTTQRDQMQKRMEQQIATSASKVVGTIENQYRSMYDALHILANRSIPHSPQEKELWNRDSIKFIDNYDGLVEILWLDAQFSLRERIPTSDNSQAGFSFSREHDWLYSVLWVPLYEAHTLQGFFVGIIDLSLLVQSIVSIYEEYQLFTITNFDQEVYVSPLWKDGWSVQSFIHVPYGGRLALYSQATPKTMREIRANANLLFILAVLFSSILILITYVAQNQYVAGRLSELRLSTLLEEAHLVAFVLDSSGIIRYSNDFFARMIGLDRSELFGKTWLSIASKAEDQQDEGVPCSHGEYIFKTAKNDIRWVTITAIPVNTQKGSIKGYTCIGEDITDRKQSQNALQERLENIQALFTINQSITARNDLHDTLSIILDQIVGRLHVDAVDVLLLDPLSHTLKFAIGRGFYGSQVEQVSLKLGEGGGGRAALQKDLFSCCHIHTKEKDFFGSHLLHEEYFTCFHAVPLIIEQRVLGVLEVFEREHHELTEEWIDYLKTLGQQVAIAIDNAHLIDDLIQAYDQTIEGWSRALDLRDKETENHTKRVTEVTVLLGRSIGMSEEELVHVRRGALLHDIGKMGVPDHILFKKEPLTEEEWAIIKKHPVYAYELLSDIAYLQPALDIPYCHHEKWDGSGYPRGLKQEEIPLSARLFAVVDVWDALLSNRPYRPGWPKEEVFAHIEKLSGTHFDPEAVRLFFSVLHDETSGICNV